MDKFLEFIGRYIAPILMWLSIVGSLLSLTVFFAFEYFRQKKSEEEIKKEKRKKEAKKRLRRMQKSNKKPSLLARIIKAKIREIHKPKTE